MVLEPDAAGIDIGAEKIYVAVPPDRDEESTSRFSSFTGDLHALPIGSAGAGSKGGGCVVGNPAERKRRASAHARIRASCTYVARMFVSYKRGTIPDQI